MMGSETYNQTHITKDNKQTIQSSLTTLSHKNPAIRKHLTNQHCIYPKQTETAQKSKP